MGLVDRLDNWGNALTGLGGLRDKVQAYVFARRGRTNDEELEAMYEEDDVASKICDSVPEHMLRRGFKVVIDGDPDMSKAVEDYIDALDGVECLTDALVWERVFGGGVMVLGLDDGQDVGLPLDEDQLRAIRFINVLDRRDIIPIYWYNDPNQPKYGKPEIYRITYFTNGVSKPKEPGAKSPTMSMEVHESRLLVFGGMRSTLRNRMRNHGWGASMLSRIRGPLRTFHGNWQSVEHLMTDASQGVYKLKGLLQAIASGKTEELQTRMEITEMGRSVGRAIMVDADAESYERKDTSMSGLPDLLDRTATRLAMAARAPVTVVMGISPAGLNATGDSDIRNWYDVLEAERKQKLRKPVTRLVRLVMISLEGPTNGVVPEKWEVEFPPLWQPTEAEKATTFSTRATAMTGLVTSAVITPEEAAMELVKSGDLDISTDAREEAIESYEDKLANGEDDLPPTPALPGAPTPAPALPGVPAPKALPSPPKPGT